MRDQIILDEGSNALCVTSKEGCIELEYPVVLRQDDQAVFVISLNKFLLSIDDCSSVSLFSRALIPYCSEVFSGESDGQFSRVEIKTLLCSIYIGRRLHEGEENYQTILHPLFLQYLRC